MLLAVGAACTAGLGEDWPWSAGTSPGHEFVQLLLVLLVLSSDGVLGLLLHGLNEVLHVLEGIDLQQDKGTGRHLARVPTSGNELLFT